MEQDSRRYYNRKTGSIKTKKWNCLFEMSATGPNKSIQNFTNAAHLLKDYEALLPTEKNERRFSKLDSETYTMIN